MAADILISILGILVFLFIFWHRVKDDYSSNIIFTTGFLIIFGILSFALLSQKIYPGWWFWASLLGGTLGLTFGTLKFKLRVFETLEAAILGLFPWIILVFWEDSVKNSSLSSLVYSVGVLALLGFFYFLDKHYKNFSWYHSGRVGFAGMTTAGFFFLTRASIAFFFPYVLSFVGKFETLLSGLGAFIFFLFTYNLAREKT